MWNVFTINNEYRILFLALFALGGAHILNSEYLTVKRPDGTPVTVPEHVERIAVNGISLSSVLMLLGVEKKIVAAMPEVAGNSWYRRICPSIALVATPFKSTVDIEALLVSNPDLVIVWSGATALEQQCVSANLPVVSVSYGTPDEFLKTLLFLGTILGKDATLKAQRYVKYYRSKEMLVKKTIDSAEIKNRKKVYYCADNPFNTESSASIVESWIRTAGGINIAAEIKTDAIRINIDPETLIRWDPEVIITRDPECKQTILSDKRLQTCSAVKNRNIVTNPKGVNLWCTRAGESALQLLWSAQLLYPEYFKGVAMKQETENFYREFYGYQLTDNEIDDILNR